MLNVWSICQSHTNWSFVGYDDEASSCSVYRNSFSSEINVQMTEHSINTPNLNVVLREIQRDTECEKVTL